MNDPLLKRLREAGNDYTIAWGSGELYDEAADEIERLTAELERIRNGIAADRCDGDSEWAAGVNAACDNHRALVASGVQATRCTYPQCACEPNGDIGCNNPNAAAPQPQPAGVPDYETHQTNGLAWAVSRWQAEVAQRPLVNVHRRTLDDTWRQVIRYFGGDPEKLIGSDHDTLLMREQEARAWKPPASGVSACVSTVPDAAQQEGEKK